MNQQVRGCRALRMGASAFLAAVGVFARAEAALYVDPSGGQVLFADTVSRDDFPVLTRTLDFEYRFFGVNRSSVGVSINGNLNFSGDPEWNNGPLSSAGVVGSTRARIAPLWDDLAIVEGSGARIVESRSLEYYAVTWEGLGVFADNQADRMTFQAILFNGAIQLRGQDFLKGDIVFAYDRIEGGFHNGSATVGLDSGDGARVRLFPGSPANGLIPDAQKELLPLDGYILFRDDGAGGYSSAVVRPVPEPGPMLLACLGSAGWLGWAWARSRYHGRAGQ